MISEKITEFVNRKKDIFIDVSDRIWDHPETGLEEFYSSEAIMEVLRNEGFSVESGISGIETAFSFLQPAKAFLPMVLTFLPMVTDLSFLLPLKALAAMAVTFTFCPLTLIVSGTLTVAALFAGFLKVAVPSAVMVYLPLPSL